MFQKKIALFIFFSALFFGQADANDFRASVIKVEITPDNAQMLLGYQARKSTGVADKLYHRILLLDDGKTRFILASSDICLISPSEYDKVASRLKAAFKIDPKNFWWTATHTHSAPEFGPAGLPGVFMGERYEHKYDEAYAALVGKQLIDGIEKAIQALAPAQLGIGWGFSQANINRRGRYIDGKTVLGMNPDGPVDRKIGILKLMKQDGGLLATVANYAIHGTVLGSGNLLISGDVQGVVAEYVEEQTGAPMLFINGAAGNIAPIYSGDPSPQMHLGEFKLMLGNKILEASNRVNAYEKEVRLQTRSIIVESPRKQGLGWPSDMGRYTRVNKAGVNLVRIPVSFLKINEETAIWGAPLELFCEVSNKVRDNSPFANTLYFGYCNGWLGYMPAEAEMKYGGYEVDMVCAFTASGPADLYEAVISYLQGELRNP